MSEETKIEWADCTGGPWLVCSKVSPGCGNCYACALAGARHQHIIRNAYRLAGIKDWETCPIWGDRAPRVRTKGFWKDARRLNRKAARAGIRLRMFPSLMDWLDDMPAGIVDQEGNWLNGDQVLGEFLETVHECTSLDWLLLTKRPENWMSRLVAAFDVAPEEIKTWLEPWIWGAGKFFPANVWIGTSVEDQRRADERIPKLLQIPARVRFLSCEPLLGPVDLRDASFDNQAAQDALGVDWVIVGGESGTNARPMHPDWARLLRDQCVAAHVAFFFKQWGEWGLPTPSTECDCSPSTKVYNWGGQTLHRVGKKSAGRLLDGREWSEFPKLEVAS